MANGQSSDSDDSELHPVRIFQEGNETYQFIVRHFGQFRLDGYEDIDLEVRSPRLVKRA